MTRTKASTISDVAERAGVSVGTVSRVLNDAGCPPQTRRRVRAAMAELNYVPNHLARSLKRQATDQIALVIPDIGNPVYVAMAKGVETAARDAGYHIALVSTDGNAREQTHALANLEQKRVDGVVFCSLTHTPSLLRALRSGASRVCVVGQLPDGSGIDNVRIDSATGVEQGMQHLVDGGRSRIAFVNGTRATVPALARERGYRRALDANLLPYEPTRVAHGDFTAAGGYHAVDALLARHPDTDALFCANDAMALGALRRLAELGRRAPEEVAVIGMDDIDMARLATPTLTSVTLLAAERGRLAAELLLGRLARGGAGEPRTLTLTPRLVVRESSTGYREGCVGRVAERDA